MIATPIIHAADKVPVTVDNFIRAESDKYFSARVALSGIGKLGQVRELMPIDKQTVIRSNRDTLSRPESLISRPVP